jgi:Asp-tRNA(Asn)/Glu-tRNA(Gln) amidotransferase A subunit family amidase
MKKSSFFSVAVLVTLTSTLLNINAFAADSNLHDLTLQQTQRLLKTQKLTSVELANYYLERIARFDKQGPTINAIAQMNSDLLSQAKALDEKIASGQALGALFGAVVVVKDNIDIQGLSNTAGSYLLREHFPKNSAFVIQQLLAADALILGKTNLSEWANFRSSMSSSGWSSLHGQTVNPHDIRRSPCGSSSGSGAAIAADFALLAIGTETDGSVTCPAAVNGIVGIKPTLGLVSRSGIIPIAHSQDTAGPMTRTVSDAVALLDVMMAKDDNDPQALPPLQLSQYLLKGGLKGKRIGIARNLMGYHSELDKVFEQQLEILRQAGAILVDNADIETKGQWDGSEYTVLLAEFKADLQHYLSQSDAPFKTLADAIRLNHEFAAQTMPIFGQEIFIAAQQAPGLDEQAYLTALADSKKFTRELGIDATLAKHQLAMLIAPTTAPAWMIDHIDGDHYMGSAGSAAAVSGYPHITVPMGRVKHMPVNISFIGGYLSEPVLVQAAYEYEQLSQARISPQLDK